MKYLVFDTETTGLFDFSKPAHDEGQPRLAQLGMIFLDSIDAEPRKVGMLIKPDGWEMPAAAGAINGLTTEYLAANGHLVDDALALYCDAIEDGYTVVAFNAQFDTKVMRAELRRAGLSDMFEETKNICVMQAAAEYLYTQRGFGTGTKRVSLANACKAFGIQNDKAHDALGDAEAATAILKLLHAAGALPDPAVKYAKAQPAKGAPLEQIF